MENTITLNYVCTSKYHPADGFTLFARILEENADTVTFEKYMEFGTLFCGKSTFPREKFEEFYRKAKTNEIVTVSVKNIKY